MVNEDEMAPASGTPPKRAAEYVRMSTDHQRYSTENQGVVIRKYAAARGYEIVRTYADEGKSGLSLGGRDALQQLLEDVQAGRADYTAVLVYDISRWGRFQDADESAFHEYLCKRAGVAVHFCAEQFENDGSLRNLLQQRGSLSAFVIDEAPGLPSSSAYRQRFGSLGRVYRMVGASARDDGYVEVNRALRAMFPAVVERTVAEWSAATRRRATTTCSLVSAWRNLASDWPRRTASSSTPSGSTTSTACPC